jgi:hypothetical protein
MMNENLPMNAPQEIVSLHTPNQFTRNHTAYACGFVSVFSCLAMAPPGKAPTQSPEHILHEALNAYTRYNGNHNQWGMTLLQLYRLLHEVGLHYQGLPLNMGYIKGWLQRGYPVIIAVRETSIHDIDLKRRVPYPWYPTGSHMIIATGIEGNNLVCRDSANITPPNTLRSQPRRYDAILLAQGLVHATVIVPPWLARPLSADPTKEPPVNAPHAEKEPISTAELTTLAQSLYSAYTTIQSILKGK